MDDVSFTDRGVSDNNYWDKGIVTFIDIVVFVTFHGKYGELISFEIINKTLNMN